MQSLSPVATLLSPIATLVGVLLGAWLARQTGETNWLRQLRIDRYTRLLKDIDSGNEALVEVVSVLSQPGSFEDRVAWEGSTEEKAEELVNMAEKVKWTVAELSLFASPEVSSATQNILAAWSQLLEALASSPDTPVEQTIATPDPADLTTTGADVAQFGVTPDASFTSRETASGGSDDTSGQWPTPDVLQAAEYYTAARDQINEGLSTFRGILVSSLRADLGVDRTSSLHQLWWTIKRKTGVSRDHKTPIEDASHVDANEVTK